MRNDFEQPPRGAYAELSDLLALRFAARQLDVTSRRRALSQLTGSNAASFRGRGLDFDEVRGYQPGDDIRAIDWRVTARRQAPHTRVYREERERPVLLAADLRSPMFFGSRVRYKSVQVCALAALLGWNALAGGDRVGGLVCGDSEHEDIRPRRRRHSLMALLRLLHRYANRLTTPCPQGPVAPLSQWLDKLRHSAHTGAAVQVLSDFHDLDDACEQRLFELSRHNDVTLIQIQDPLESALPPDPELSVSDGRRHFRLADLSALEAMWRRRDQRLRQFCRRLALPLLRVSTADDPVAALQPLHGRPGGRSPRPGGST